MSLVTEFHEGVGQLTLAVNNKLQYFRWSADQTAKSFEMWDFFFFFLML